MKEELVTLETAYLLKEKGFDERTLYAYQNNGMLYNDGNRIPSSYNSLPVPNLCEEFFECDAKKTCLKCKLAIYLIAAPNQSTAQKWLRETKNLHISIIRNACGYSYDICKAENGTHITDGIFKGPNDGGQWDTYEEALEVGIQESLKLIKL